MNQFSNFVCFRLGTLSRRIARYYNNRFAELGITLGQSFVLFSLLEHDGSNVKEIANAVQLDSPAVTGLVDRLIKEGLVERREDPGDRRSIQVYLTGNGRQIANKAMVIAQEFNLHMTEDQDQEFMAAWEKRLEELERIHAKD
ncbi:MAG: MarR family winged helix-turn-helix transcriptional regulator [Methylocystaceae bacterium]